MKKILVSLAVLALVASFLMAGYVGFQFPKGTEANQAGWELIDAHKFPEDLEDNEAEVFASRVADLVLDQYPSLTEEVKNQLHKFISQLVLEVNYLGFSVEQLEVKTDTLKKRVELLEIAAHHPEAKAQVQVVANADGTHYFQPPKENQ